MIWFVVLGLFSFTLIFIGCRIAVGRFRRYREESELRRARAFTEMMEIAERQNAGRRTPLGSARDRQDAE